VPRTWSRESQRPRGAATRTDPAGRGDRHAHAAWRHLGLVFLRTRRTQTRSLFFCVFFQRNRCFLVFSASPAMAAPSSSARREREVRRLRRRALVRYTRQVIYLEEGEVADNQGDDYARRPCRVSAARLAASRPRPRWSRTPRRASRRLSAIHAQRRSTSSRTAIRAHGSGPPRTSGRHREARRRQPRRRE